MKLLLQLILIGFAVFYLFGAVGEKMTRNKAFYFVAALILLAIFAATLMLF